MNKLRLVFRACLFFLFVSCNEDEGSNQSMRDSLNKDSAVSNSLSILEACYLMIQQRDSAMLTLSVVDNIVSGKLQYRRFEKDHNNGVIKGIVRDNLIVADYIFQSEGTSTVREVIFSIKNDSLFEAYGDIMVSGDTAKFVNPNQLKFMSAPFVKVNCAVQ